MFRLTGRPGRNALPARLIPALRATLTGRFAPTRMALHRDPVTRERRAPTAMALTTELRASFAVAVILPRYGLTVRLAATYRARTLALPRLALQARVGPRAAGRVAVGPRLTTRVRLAVGRRSLEAGPRLRAAPRLVPRLRAGVAARPRIVAATALVPRVGIAGLTLPVYALAVRFAPVLREVGMATHALDLFSEDGVGDPERGTDLEVIVHMRVVRTGQPVVGAHGTLVLENGGTAIGGSPYTLAPDSTLGDGHARCVVAGADLLARGTYRGQVVLYDPLGGQALREFVFAFA